jgi:thiol-disulfide isomerase/thioredoxin
MLSNYISSPKQLALVLVMVFASSIAACTSRKPAHTEATPVLSGPANTTYPMPPLKAHSEMGWAFTDGKRATLGEYQGKVLVLDFYATWCAPCRESIPRLIALQENYSPADLQIIGLNVGGPDDRVKVAEFARELNIQYSLGFPDKSLTDLFLSDNDTIPQTFVFDRQGQLVKRFIGYEKSTGTQLEQLIRSETATALPSSMAP